MSGALTLTDGNLNTGTVAAQGPISQASTFDGNTGTLLINGTGAQTFTGASTTALGNLPNLDQQALGHPHPGRHDPDDPQLDVHRGHRRPGTRRSSSATASGLHTPNAVDSGRHAISTDDLSSLPARSA